MNKKELIKELKKVFEERKENVFEAFFDQQEKVLKLVKKLDEPKAERCEFIEE